MNYWTKYVLLLLLIVGAFFASSKVHSLSDVYLEKHSVRAILVDAYSYQTGSKSSLHTEWEGRFSLPDYPDYKWYVDREIGGFLYQNFVNKGSKPFTTEITMSMVDFGSELPWHYYVSGLTWFVSIVGFFWVGICGIIFRLLE